MQYIEDLIAFNPDGPYCLAGYSFGGFLAYEMARQLSNRGLRIGHLGIIDTGPSVTGGSSLREVAGGFHRFLKNIPWWIWEDLLDCRPTEMLKRTRRKAHEMRKRLRKVSGSNMQGIPIVDLEDIFELSGLPEDHIRTMDGHLELLRAYAPGPYSGPLTLYRARTRPLFSPSTDDLGWRAHVREDIEIINLPGNHETIINEPYVRNLAKALRTSLETVA
jgi:thioesterase domain-containing protein